MLSICNDCSFSRFYEAHAPSKSTTLSFYSNLKVTIYKAGFPSKIQCTFGKDPDATALMDHMAVRVYRAILVIG